MNRTHIRSLAGLAAVVAAGLAQGQFPGTNGWFYECIDPTNTAPYSTDYGARSIGNQLFRAAHGVSGTVTYGGQNGPCYAPTSQTLNAVGRFAFSYGTTGSVQTTFDDSLALTMGAPTDPVGSFCYAKVLVDGNTNAESLLFGEGGLRVSYTGASKRYMIATWTTAELDVELQQKLIGDACRMRWRIRNLTADTHSYGLFFAAHPGMRTRNASVTDPEISGVNQAHSLIGSATGLPKGIPGVTGDYIGYTVLPSTKPVRNERRYDSLNPKFPPKVNFLFGQNAAYGMRIDNISPPETPDASNTDLILIGNFGDFQSPGLIQGNNVRLVVFGDVANNPAPFEEADVDLNQTAFVQRFPAVSTGTGQVREVVHYVRSSWGVSDYVDPYAVVMDAPRLIATDPSGNNGVSPNPFTVRMYIDNQFATLDREVQLRNVKMTIFLPEGLSLVAGELQKKTLPIVNPNQIAFIDWQVRSDGVTAGQLPISVKVEPTPGPTKTLTGTVQVAPSPKLGLPAGANLVTIPYTFEDTSMDDILQLQAGVDYLAYRWDPAQFGYVPAPSVERGLGYWIVPTSDQGFIALKNAQLPTDTGTGGLVVTLRQGWNLIGNPYSFPVPLSHLVLVVEDAPNDAISWLDATSANYVQASLAFWDRDETLPNGGSYGFTQGVDTVLEPHRGYWVYSNTFKPIRISWPSVFIEGLTGTGRKAETGWQQSERHWRLQLSARTSKGIDAQNFVAMSSDDKAAGAEIIRKPPVAPKQDVQLFVEEMLDGKQTRMAQAVSRRTGKKEWRIGVTTESAGEVTVTWPNLGALPRGLRFKLTDAATNEVRDLRSQSGYTFRATEAGTRYLKVSVEVGGANRPVIGNVLVSRPTRDVSAPVSITYALSADALVSVRVLSNTGKEVFTVSRGRAENAGQNTVNWAMRDNANRAVAPGVYRVEVVAETPTGERVRKVVPVNVVR